MHNRFTIEEHVRWSDIDRAGIIYYGQFQRFGEIAEAELFRAAGLPYSEVFDRFEIWLPRGHIQFDFRKPLVLDDLIEVSTYVARLIIRKPSPPLSRTIKSFSNGWRCTSAGTIVSFASR